MVAEKIFLGDINADLKKETLQEFLSQFGEVASLQWKMRNALNRPPKDAAPDQKGERVRIAHAVVEFGSFKHEGGAMKVIELLDGKTFPNISKPNGEPLRAKIYEKREPKEPTTKKEAVAKDVVAKEPRAKKLSADRTVPSKFKVFVRNLPFSFNGGKLRELFEEKGFEVAYAQVLKDRQERKDGNGTFLRSRGYGFVEFGIKRPQVDIDHDQNQLDMQAVSLEEGTRKPRAKSHKLRKDLSPAEEATIAKEVQRAVAEVNGVEVDGRVLAVAVSMEREEKKEE